MHARLYVVVTPSLCRHPVADTVAAAVEGGAGAVQLRWKEAADAEFVALARDLGALCHGLGVPFLINDRDGLYEACGADGIHLGEDDLPPEEFRRRFGDARVAVLCASAAGKRWREGLSALLPLADVFVVTEPSGTTGEDPAAIAAWLAGRGARSEVAADAASGLRRLRELPGPRLVVGSFYLAGAVRRLLDRPST